MSNIILKISDGELFNFFDSEEKKEFTVGSKRTCDVVVKGFFVAPEQLRFIQKNNVWYVEDLTPEGYKSEVLTGGKRFKRPVVRFDSDIVIRKTGEKRGDTVKISSVKKITRKRGGSNFDLTQKTLTVVGRDPSCDIVVDNPMVSEKHFRIVYDGSDYYIEDLRSIGGTFVNNRKIRRARLGDYDRISIPSAAYTFYERKLLYSTSPAGIQIDAVGVTKDVADRKSHGKARLVNAVSFRIEPGAFVAIVGGSGTGKSTLLDCLNGLRPATDGGIYYDTNAYYDNIRSYKNVIGYVPQKDIMHDDLTVETALRYTAMLRMRSKMPGEEIRARVKEAIADVKLSGRENLKISALSGGQRKRVSIAMELLSDPKVIFLDEPTSGLSPDLDLEMMDLLKELAGKGRTIVVITHAMENLDKCDRIAFLGKGGRLCFYGEHKDVFRYFNRKSYSRIFAALNDDTLCAYFESKYRSGEYYKELYSAFCEQYADAKACMLPPETGKKTLRQTAEETSAAEVRARRTLADKAAEWKAAIKAKRAARHPAEDERHTAEEEARPAAVRTQDCTAEDAAGFRPEREAAELSPEAEPARAGGDAESALPADVDISEAAPAQMTESHDKVHEYAEETHVSDGIAEDPVDAPPRPLAEKKRGRPRKKQPPAATETAADGTEEGAADDSVNTGAEEAQNDVHALSEGTNDAVKKQSAPRKKKAASAAAEEEDDA